MRTPIKWAELHSPLFLAGSNLGLKLDPKGRVGLSMEYDEEKRHLYVTYNNKTARVPEPSILSMNEGSNDAVPEKPKPVVVSKVVAQVSSPQDHVFAGPGAGKTK